VLTDYPAKFGCTLGSTRRNHSYREAMVTIWKIAEGDTTTGATLGRRLIQLHATKTQNPILSSSSTKNQAASMENKKIGKVPTCPLCLLSLFCRSSTFPQWLHCEKKEQSQRQSFRIWLLHAKPTLHVKATI
jgi:hypothetical protein